MSLGTKVPVRFLLRLELTAEYSRFFTHFDLCYVCVVVSAVASQQEGSGFGSRSVNVSLIAALMMNSSLTGCVEMKKCRNMSSVAVFTVYILIICCNCAVGTWL